MFYKECGILTLKNYTTYSQKLKNKKKLVYPRSTWKVIWTRLNVSVRSRLNWNLEVLVFEERENRSTRRKTSRSREENQQQTQPTYGVNAGIWTRATLVGGERSHYCATLAPLLTYFGPEKETPLGRGLRVPVSALWRVFPRALNSPVLSSFVVFNMCD